MARPAMKPSRGWTRAPQGKGARLAITLFALLAFTLQSYVTQTHIHGTAWAGTAIAKLALGRNTTQNKLPGKGPRGDDPANCQICQEILHTGLYITPPPAALLLLTVSASVAPIAADIKTIAQLRSHNWQSRAPPFA